MQFLPSPAAVLRVSLFHAGCEFIPVLVSAEHSESMPVPAKQTQRARQMEAKKQMLGKMESAAECSQCLATQTEGKEAE